MGTLVMWLWGSLCGATMWRALLKLAWKIVLTDFQGGGGGGGGGGGVLRSIKPLQRAKYALQTLRKRLVPPSELRSQPSF